MAIIERTYNIPLRKEFQKAPMYRRAKRAVNAVRAFLEKHMKSATVKLGPQLNHTLWARGIRHPPAFIKVTAARAEDGVVKAELFGVKYEEKKASAPAEEKKTKTEKAEEHVHKEGEEHTHEHDSANTPSSKTAEKPAVKKADHKEGAEKTEKKAAKKTTEKKA